MNKPIKRKNIYFIYQRMKYFQKVFKTQNALNNDVPIIYFPEVIKKIIVLYIEKIIGDREVSIIY